MSRASKGRESPIRGGAGVEGWEACNVLSISSASFNCIRSCIFLICYIRSTPSLEFVAGTVAANAPTVGPAPAAAYQFTL